MNDSNPSEKKCHDMQDSNDSYWKLTLAVLTVSAFMMSMSYTMMMPFLPMYLLLELHVPEADLNFWTSTTFSISFFIAAVCAPFWGAMADKHSKKMMALRASLSLAVCYFLLGLVETAEQLFVVRALQGFSCGLWPSTLAIMSGYAPKQRVGFCMGTMQAGMTAGTVLGPLIGGAISEYFAIRTSFYWAGLAMTVIFVLLLLVVKEKPAAKQTTRNNHATEPRAAANPLRDPVIQRMLFAGCIGQMSLLLVQPVLPMYLGELQGSMDRIIFLTGVVFSVVGIAGVLASTPWGIAGQRFGYRPVLYITLTTSGIFGILQTIPSDIVSFTIVRFIGGLCMAGVFPAINAVITNTCPPEHRGKIFGYSYSTQQFGCVLGPLLGGWLASQWGNVAAVAASGVVLLPLALMLYCLRPKNTVSHELPSQNG